MAHLCGQCLAEWLGSKWGDQSEYLVCENCDYRCQWDDDAPDNCPRCAEAPELVVHVPHSDAMGIRYALWKDKLVFLPQRMLLYSEDGSYAYWQWFGREWRKRPRANLLNR